MEPGNMLEHSEILNIQDLKEREKHLREYYTVTLCKQHWDTDRPSIITDEDFKEYVEIFVEYDLDFKRFPSDHPKFPNFPVARTIRNYFDYEAQVHGFKTHNRFVRWKYDEGLYKKSAMLIAMNSVYGKFCNVVGND